MNPQRFVIVTGANRGIGFAISRALAAKGAHVIMAARDLKSAEDAASRIRAEFSKASLEVMKLDLAWLESIRNFAKTYIDLGKPLHVLINNAGPINALRKLELTQDGFESFFGVNHLGHFLLSNLLLPVLKSSAPSRVITVSSMRHMGVKSVDWDNLKGEKSYDQGAFYNRTKLANLWFSYALARKLEGTGVSSLAACPGFVPQTLMVGRTGFARLMFQVLDHMPFARKPQESGDDFAGLALDPAFEDANGLFYSYGKATPSSEFSHDLSSQERLWKLSEKLVQLDPQTT